MLVDGQHISLKPLGLEQVNEFLAYRQNPEVCKFQGFDPFTKENAVAFIESQLPLIIGSRGAWIQTGIYLKSSNQLIGDCASNFKDEEPRNVEIGITLHPDFQQKGFAKDALSTLTEYLIKSFDVHKFIARMDFRNERCIGLFEKLGFVKEGQLKEDFFDKEDKEWIDLLVFGKIIPT